MMFTDEVAEWWENRVNLRFNLEDKYVARGLVYPVALETRWRRRVASDLVYLDWREDTNIDSSKNGFFTVFYRVSGATCTQGRTPVGRVRMVKFMNWTDSKTHIDKFILEN